MKFDFGLQWEQQYVPPQHRHVTEGYDFESGLNGSKLFTVEFCIHCCILNKLEVINYPFKIPPDTHQHDLTETILFVDL